MSKFIKFTKYLLNTNDIHLILIEPNKYYIHVVTKEIHGFNWYWGLGFGYISSHTCVIDVCRIKHSDDYKIVSDWISKNE